jgi:hypothetical protein
MIQKARLPRPIRFVLLNFLGGRSYLSRLKKAKESKEFITMKTQNKNSFTAANASIAREPATPEENGILLISSLFRLYFLNLN